MSKKVDLQLVMSVLSLIQNQEIWNLNTFSLKLNIDEANNLLGELIKVSEKKIENHIKEVVVILDTQDTNFINMTITKNLEDKILDKTDIDYLLKLSNDLKEIGY